MPGAASVQDQLAAFFDAHKTWDWKDRDRVDATVKASGMPVYTLRLECIDAGVDVMASRSSLPAFEREISHPVRQPGGAGEPSAACMWLKEWRATPR